MRLYRTVDIRINIQEKKKKALSHPRDKAFLQ